jgi:osmoprotectant transport system ATP-binding protein
MIKIQDLSKTYDGAVALDRVDLTVAKGEFRVIVGESGSGKTTLLKTINRLIEPDAGRIEVAGRAIDQARPALLRRNIGYAFQGVGLFPHMTVAENIAVTPQLLRWPAERIKARVETLLDLVGLPQTMAARTPSALSGGQRQRIGLARALAAEPALVLLDEPFGALDAVTREALGRDYLAIHRRLGLTTVMITHDMMEALLLGDRIAVMRAGRILAEGGPGDMLSASAHPYVGELVGTPRRQAEAVAALARDAAS